MATWRVYYRMDGDVLIDGPETEEEAREAFYSLSNADFAGSTYAETPEIDDIAYIGE